MVDYQFNEQQIRDIHHEKQNRTVDIDHLQKIRNTKYILKKRLRLLDLDRTMLVPMRSFELETYKLGINLRPNDYDYIKKFFIDQNKSHMVKYQEVLKQLVPEVQENGQIKWAFTDASKLQKTQDFSGLNFTQKMNPLMERRRTSHSGVKEGLQSTLKKLFRPHSEDRTQQEAPQQIDESPKQILKKNRAGSELGGKENILHRSGSRHQKTPSNLTELFGKILHKSHAPSEVSEQLISVGSKALNIYKNTQNTKFIKSAHYNIFTDSERKEIEVMVTKDNINVRHMDNLKKAFMSCDQVQLGISKKKAYLKKLYESNLKFPDKFFMKFLNFLQINRSDTSEEALLSHTRLEALIDVFNHTPARLKGDSNNSDGFKANIDNVSGSMNITKDRTIKNLKKIHMKIEEKFKDYRRCFRSFEKTEDGFLKLNEFVLGCENIGIRLSLEEFRHIFLLLDSEHHGLVDFSQFCKINFEKPKDFAQYVSSGQDPEKPPKFSKPPLGKAALNQTQSNPQMWQMSSKSYQFANGLAPKNKDINSLTKELNNLTYTEFVRKRRRNKNNAALSADPDHRFGRSEQSNHNMIAIIGNQYIDEGEKAMDKLSPLERKYILKQMAPEDRPNTVIVNPTKTQKLRDVHIYDTFKLSQRTPKFVNNIRALSVGRSLPNLAIDPSMTQNPPSVAAGEHTIEDL